MPASKTKRTTVPNPTKRVCAKTKADRCSQAHRVIEE
jgi:hypothetical protein